MIPLMLSEDTLRAKLSEAFLLGFMVTREGFNPECPCEHLAPSKVEPSHETAEEFTSRISSDDAFKRLQDDAVSRILSEIEED